MTVVSLFIFFLLAHSSVDCEVAQVKVTIQNGPIIGKIVIDSSTARPINRFLGIRYAEPPVGKLRFRKPRPFTEQWSEPYEALNWPNSCVQAIEFPFFKQTESLMLNKSLSEDCLFLNVWTPQISEDEDKLRPVLVWIHGGAHVSGTSSFEIYDSVTLSARTDAVIVTINYRLATLGFLYSDAVPEVSGNQGLWDQALALEWVQQNIRQFGGDPRRVTISGESAGSLSVSAHILSPVSKDLFQNAILMSGSILAKKLFVEPSVFVQKWLTGIRKVGCATEADQTINAQVVECLEKLDQVQVDLIYFILDNDPMDIQALTLIDGEFLPESPLELLSQGKYKSEANILVSTVEDEASFVLNWFQIPEFAGENPKPLPLEKAKEFLIDFLSNHFYRKPIPEELITKVYYSGLNEKYGNQDAFRKQTGIAFGDVIINCPTLEFAKALRKYNTNSTGNVYQWHYKAKLGNEEVLCLKWAGTCHFDDLYPAFGMPLRYPEDYTARERDISNEVIGFIRNFIWTGNPSSSDTNSEWLPYYTSDNGKEIIAPYYEINNNYKVPDNFKFNLKQLECENIWNRLNY